MKKLFLFFAVAAAMTSCHHNSSKDNQTEESAEAYVDAVEESSVISNNEPEAKSEEESEDEDIYTPPFKITAIYERRNGPVMERSVYEYNVLKNGRLSGTWTYQHRAAETNNPWENYGSPSEFSGKWSTSSISMGDGSLKVYCIDRSDSETTYYLPATCDYIWMCDQAWYYCENWDLNKAIKITSVEKL